MTTYIIATNHTVEKRSLANLANCEAFAISKYFAGRPEGYQAVIKRNGNVVSVITKNAASNHHTHKGYSFSV